MVLTIRVQLCYHIEISPLIYYVKQFTGFLFNWNLGMGDSSNFLLWIGFRFHLCLINFSQHSQRVFPQKEKLGTFIIILCKASKNIMKDSYWIL